MYLLAIDSSAKATSVCLLMQEMLMGEYFLNASFPHSKTMMSMCENLLKQCAVPPTAVDLFAVSHGPGSFTGLRIGISAIKGMAYATNKPCIGVSTLHAIALGSPEFNGILCCVMDARCGQVYYAAYRQQAGQRDRLCADQAITLTDLAAVLRTYHEPILLLGDGAQLCYNQFGGSIENLRIATQSTGYQRASSVAVVALEQWKHMKENDRATMSPDALAPIYLQLPQAQRQRLALGLSL